MNKTQKIIIIILGVLALASIIATIAIILNTQKPEEPPVEEESVLDCPMIDGTVTYEGETGKSALEILASICEIETKTSDDGSIATVTAIDDIVASDPSYWGFYVNDTYALLSPNNFQTTETDTIKWQLESLGK